MKSHNQNNKTAIITGAYGAIGKAIALALASSNSYNLTLVGRNKIKLENTVSEIINETKNTNIGYELVDLSIKSNIEEFAMEWEGPLHLLINNAATTPRHREETSAGIELQFATNVLGYMWMMEKMSKHMKDVYDSRIVNVASYWAGDLDIVDLEFKVRNYNNDTAYRQSKQADRMLTVVFAEKLKASRISVNSCHPGDVNSKLSNNLGYGGHESPARGAETPVWLALSDDMIGRTGGYYVNKKKSHCSFSSDDQSLKELYSKCQSY